jgi:hypothetical protein
VIAPAPAHRLQGAGLSAGGCYGRRMRTAGILAVLALSTAALHGQARADASRAWAAARAGLPADTKIVIGLDVVAAQKTRLFATFYPKLHDQPDVAKVLDAIKNSCKLDPLAVVQGVVFAASDERADGALYLAISGIDRNKLSSCLQAIVQAAAPQAEADKQAKVTIKQAGNITEVSRGGETGYLGWVGKDVLVVTFHAADKPSLVKWMGGKGALARSEVGKTLARVNTAAALWGARSGVMEVQPGITPRAGYGAVTFAKGQLSADLHAVMEDAGHAGAASITANQELNLLKLTGQVPLELVPVVQAIAVSADNDEVRIKASVAEKDVLGAITYAIDNFGN